MWSDINKNNVYGVILTRTMLTISKIAIVNLGRTSDVVCGKVCKCCGLWQAMQVLWFVAREITLFKFAILERRPAIFAAEWGTSSLSVTRVIEF